MENIINIINSSIDVIELHADGKDIHLFVSKNDDEIDFNARVMPYSCGHVILSDVHSYYVDDISIAASMYAIIAKSGASYATFHSTSEYYINIFNKFSKRKYNFKKISSYINSNSDNEVSIYVINPRCRFPSDWKCFLNKDGKNIIANE